MANYPLYNFDNAYYATEANDIVKIFDFVGQSMAYIGITFNGDIFALHKEFRDLFAVHCNILPEVQCPHRFTGTSAMVIPTKCLIPSSLHELRGSWFFESERVYEPTVLGLQRKPFYATISYKSVLLSIFQTVKLFENTNFRPVLDLRKMFLSQNGGIIFTQYKIRGPNDDDLPNLISLINTILGNHGNSSPTLHCEFYDLTNWLINSWFDPRTQIENVLRRVVFWTPQMRIDYIYLLWNYLRSSRLYDGYPPSYTIQRFARTAFADVNHNCHWYNSLESSQHPILWNIVSAGNRHFNYSGPNELKPKCIYRTSKLEGQTDTFILCCGLTRVRDSYEHIEQIAPARVPIFPNITPLQLQSSYQDYFPRHMLEFGNLEPLINFNAQRRVMMLLRAHRNEDLSLANLAI